jgi:hypothetical protein
MFIIGNRNYFALLITLFWIVGGVLILAGLGMGAGILYLKKMAGKRRSENRWAWDFSRNLWGGV